MSPVSRRSILPFITLVLLASVVFGCNFRTDPRYAARKKLTEIGIVYSKSSFLQRVYEGDILATGLFLEAGMNPNVEVDFGRYILQPDSDVQRWMNGLNSRSEVWTRMVLGNSGSLGLQGANYRQVSLPVFMIARIKAGGNAPEYREIVEMFNRQGVSNEVAQVREERIRNDLRSADNEAAKVDTALPKDDKFFKDITKEVERRTGSARE